MKLNTLKLLAIVSIFFSAAVIESCGKKDDPTPTTPTTKTPTATNPQFRPKDGAGALAAVQTVTYVSYFGTSIETPIGLGIAVFTNNAFSAFVDGGTVSLNSNTLTKQTDNSYVYSPGASSVTGIDLTDQINWSVSGNTTNGVPAITHTVDRSMPNMSDIDNNGTVATTAAFTLKTLTGISNADSTYFTISGPNKAIQKVVSGNTQSVTFTSTEMASLGTGVNSGLIQIAPYNIETQVYSSKKYYFIQEKVVSKIVTLQ